MGCRRDRGVAVSPHVRHFVGAVVGDRRSGGHGVVVGGGGDDVGRRPTTKLCRFYVYYNLHLRLNFYLDPICNMLAPLLAAADVDMRWW